jgi:hypothetical protein
MAGLMGRAPEYLFRQGDHTLMYVDYGYGASSKAYIGEEEKSGSSSNLSSVPTTDVATCRCPCAFIEMKVRGEKLTIDSEETETEPTFMPGVIQDEPGESDEPTWYLTAKWGSESLEVLNLENYVVEKISDNEVRISKR